MTYHYETLMQVRDYECDLQGIVNNANYLHYCEHTRHLFLKQCGITFAEMHQQGEDAVVARMQLQYKTPLRSDDEFRSCLRIKRDGLKYIFYQDLWCVEKVEGEYVNKKLAMRAVVEVVCVVNGQLSESKLCDEAFKEYL